MGDKMSEPIIVVFESIELAQSGSGNKVCKTIDGKQFIIKKDKNLSFPLHTPVKVLAGEQKIGNRTQYWINWVGNVDSVDQHIPKPMTAPMPPKPQEKASNLPTQAKNTSKYTNDDIKAFRAKDDQIRQIAALNNSVGMVQACANSSNDGHFTGMSIAEVVKYWKNLQNSFYKEYYNQLSGNSGSSEKQSIPGSGIEVAEEVTSEEYNSGEEMD